jgi:BirA family transcriptional regulator, biotin operon repressor / biotin---[acetyl-CoA-carboxylase] ligase
MPQTEPLNWGAEALWLALEPLLPGLSIEVLPRVVSTNTLLLERVRQASDLQPCLLVAEEQTAGRGRLGRSWHSRAGASLTFSLSLPLQPADWSGLSLAVGLALADALDPPRDLVPVAPRIGLKWPNDLWLIDAHEPIRGRKLGGILIETVGAGAQRVAVVGVGLNLRPLPPADEGYSQGHASLDEYLDDCSPPAVLARVAAPLLRALLQFANQGFAPRAAAYARRDVLRGRAITTTLPDWPDGQADGVDEGGALCLRRDGRLHRLVSGEVSVRPQAAAAAGRGR